MKGEGGRAVKGEGERAVKGEGERAEGRPEPRSRAVEPRSRGQLAAFAFAFRQERLTDAPLCFLGPGFAYFLLRLLLSSLAACSSSLKAASRLSPGFSDHPLALHPNQVAGEKEVLEHYLEHCRVTLKMLSLSVNDDEAYAVAVRAVLLTKPRRTTPRTPLCQSTPFEWPFE